MTDRSGVNPDNTPAHLRPQACHVCGHDGEHPDGDHTYWSNADADREFTAEERRARATGTHPDGEFHDPAAAYVAEHRPY